MFLNFPFCSCVLAFLTICHMTEAQFAVGYSPSAQVGRNHLNNVGRGEQNLPGQSTCMSWRDPSSMDKLVAPYAQRMCNQWSPMPNGNGPANSMPGFGYNPYNTGVYGGGYGGNGYGYSGGFSNPNPYGGGFGGFNNPYGGGYAAPVVGYNPFQRRF